MSSSHTTVASQSGNALAGVDSPAGHAGRRRRRPQLAMFEVGAAPMDIVSAEGLANLVQ